MNRETMMEAVRRQMPAKRWEHTNGVMTTAVQLAKRFGGNEQQADLAALLHDYCKYWPVDRQFKVLSDAGEVGDLANYDKQLWHGPAAAIEARNTFGIEDVKVLNAIRYHTSGRVGMTKLDKIVCLADYIEPGRDFPQVNNIRKLAEHSLESALTAGFDSTISYLLSKGQKIYPLTILARNDLLDEIHRKSREEDDD